MNINQQNRCERKRGSVRIALVLVSVILAMLGAIGTMAIQTAREAGRRTQCTCHLKQLGLAIHGYHDLHQGIPPATLAASGINGEPPALEDGVTWCTMLLPFVGMDPLYDKLDLTATDYAAQQQGLLQKDDACSKTFLCPSRRSGTRKCTEGNSTDGDAGPCGDYAAVACHPKDNSLWFNVTGAKDDNMGGMIGAERYTEGKNARILWRSRTSFACVTDGISNTFAIGEKHISSKGVQTVAEGDGCMYYYHSKNPRPIDSGKLQAKAAAYSLRAINWTTLTGKTNDSIAKKGPDDVPNNAQFGAWHTGVCLFAMLDGAVKQIRTNADANVLAHVANRADGVANCVDDH